jgi:hypothetical protein
MNEIVVPIRELSDEEAIAWLRSNGPINLTHEQLGRRWGWERYKVSRRLRAWDKAGQIVRDGSTITVPQELPQLPRALVETPAPKVGAVDCPKVHSVDGAREFLGAITAPSTAPIVAPSVAPSAPSSAPTKYTGASRAAPWSTPGARSVGGLDVLAIASATTLTGVAGYLSVRGLVVLFPGVSTIILGASLECGKLVTVAWLAQHWRCSSWIVRIVLAALVLIIAGINAAGVYSQLVAQHVGKRGAAEAVTDVQRETIDAKIVAQAHVVADIDRRIGQIDAIVEESARRGRMGTAQAALDTQRRARQGLQDERKREGAALSGGRTGRALSGGRPHPSNRDRICTDPIRCCHLRRHRSGDSHPMARAVHDACMRPAGDRADMVSGGQEEGSMKQPVHFRVGQRVCCIDASPNRLHPVKLLTAGRIYTIRAIDRGNWKPKPPGYGLHLENIVIFYPGRKTLWAFHPGRFRAVTERPTDITVFTDILEGQLRLPSPKDMEDGLWL